MAAAGLHPGRASLDVSTPIYLTIYKLKNILFLEHYQYTKRSCQSGHSHSLLYVDDKGAQSAEHAAKDCRSDAASKC